jgi:predicted lipoprotein with Yx(FWY)xxD motif
MDVKMAMRSGMMLAATLLSLGLAGSVAAQDMGAPKPAAPPAPQAPLPPVVTVRPMIGGTVYADLKGRSLYTLDRDQDGKSSCAKGCIGKWRPFAAAWTTGAIGDWTVIDRPDGVRQWALKGKPLYLYAEDQKPGEIRGDGQEQVWHAAVKARDFVPPGIAIKPIPDSSIGPAFVTAEGMTIYFVYKYKYNAGGNTRYNSPSPGPAGCTGECLQSWTPVAAPSDAVGGGDWTVVDRDDGTKQWAYKKFPLYTYSKDRKPGDALGEGVNTIQDSISGLFWSVAALNNATV